MLEIFYNPIFIAVMFIFFFTIYRHSARWILEPIELEMLVHNISLTSYKLTRWFFILFSFLSLIHLLLVQTFTTLDLRWNDIKDSATQHLRNALQNNTVIFILIPSLPYSSSSLHTDTHDIGHWLQSNRRCWCTTSRWCLTK
jgi:hypothetical protein